MNIDDFENNIAEDEARRIVEEQDDDLICRKRGELMAQLHYRSGEEWRPIKTAPRDGTKILLFDDGEIYAGRWSWIPSADVNEPYLWVWTDNAVEDFVHRTYKVYKPSHWLPLPSAPLEYLKQQIRDIGLDPDRAIKNAEELRDEYLKNKIK